MSTELGSCKATRSWLPKPSASTRTYTPIRGPSKTLCHQCLAMLSTVDGIRQVLSRYGYTHHKLGRLIESSQQGCPLCLFLYKRAFPNSPGLGICPRSTEPSMLISGWRHDEAISDIDDVQSKARLSSLSIGRTDTARGYYYQTRNEQRISDLRLFGTPGCPFSSPCCLPLQTIGWCLPEKKGRLI